MRIHIKNVIARSVSDAAISALLIAFLFSTSVKAENFDLTADDKVEWHQKENMMVAVGNAVASKKDMSIRADKMTAYYASEKGKKSQITTVHALGNVKMKSPTANAFGNTLDYDLINDTVVLKGNPAKIQTEKETITATDTITYYPSKQKAIALGEVVASDKENKIYSNKMISHFKKDEKGALQIEKVEIYDNVKITTPKAVVTALKGEYLPQTGIVKLFDNVVINQDGNLLKGDMAESNLNTGVSKLISKKGRVSGVFKEKENGK